MKLIFTVFGMCCGLMLNAQQTTSLKVLVLDPEGKPYEGDKILFVGQSKHDTHSGVTDATGKFTINLPTGQVYDIRIKSIGEEMEYNELEIPTLNEGESFEDAVLTITYEAITNYTFSSLQFDTGKSSLKPESYPMLSNLVEIMILKPKMKIAVCGFTDSDGDAAANKILSQKRADAVRAYLASKGIDASRIIAIGYGEEKPVADNSTEEGKAKNRRTEIKVL